MLKGVVPKYMDVPVNYSLDNGNDSRFTKIRITVMHDGVNYNGTSFSLESMDKAKDTIKNIPILAFVKQQDGTDTADFGGHEMEWVWSEGDIKLKYLGRPIGLIPADNNDYHIEVRDGKNYVVVNGYIWNEYANEALDILKRDGVKGQSMEILVNDGQWNEELNSYEITDYQYTGLCLLGNDVPPAMEGAKAELYSFAKKDGFGEFIAKMSEEFKKYFAKNDEGGAEMTLEELLAKYSITIEDLESKGIKAEDYSLEELEAKIKEVFSEENQPEESAEEGSDSVEAPEEESVEEEFTEKVEESQEGSDEEQEGKEEFTMKDALDLIAELKLQLSAVEKELKDVKAENAELKQFKKEKLAEEHVSKANEMFAKFEDMLEENEIEDLKENVHQFSIEELEKELLIRFAKKQLTFSQSMQDKKQENKLTVFAEVKKPVENKRGWEDLIEKYRKQ